MCHLRPTGARVDTPDDPRSAQQQFCDELEQAYQNHIDRLTALCPASRERLQAVLMARCRREQRQSVLDKLLIEDPYAPIERIWDNYLYHLEHRSEAPRPARAPVQKRSQLRWQRIMDAAVAHLKSGEVISTTDICEALELPIGTLYQFFPSTDALVDKAYAALFESLLDSDPSDELANDPDNE